jgi:Cellulose synthase
MICNILILDSSLHYDLFAKLWTSTITIYMQIRVSSVISNSPIILNIDCDMYSNNSECIREALCFLLDEEQGQPIAFVQYPQDFENINSYDIYGNSLTVHNAVSLSLCSSIETIYNFVFHHFLINIC